MFVNNVEYLSDRLAPQQLHDTYDKGLAAKEGTVELPPELQFGVTNNPDGRNVYSDPASETKPIFCLEFSLNNEIQEVEDQ